MSGYRGRTGPNFSEFLSNLNTINSPYEQTNFAVEDLDLTQDLAMFTNTDFTHFDMPPLQDDVGFNFEVNEKGEEEIKYDGMFGNGNMPEQYHNPNPNPSAQLSGPVPYYSSYNTPIQPAPAPGFNNVENLLSPSSMSSSGPNSRPKAIVVSPKGITNEETSRLAAEEDKRRRNTAASARFRVKKKQREQTLEKTVKEVNDKNAKLEAKLTQLEMENKWLKDLITEKNGSQSVDEIAAAFQKFRKESEERDVKASMEDSPESS